MSNAAAPVRAYSYIRFSRPEQALGNSLRRQLEASEAYAFERGYVLDTDMQDLGLSAFRGANRREGALAAFLERVKAGMIAAGSVLLVESLDRLSREQVPSALRQFLNIMEAGITIVTLQDGYVYSEQSLNDNWTQLIISLAIMSRAHEESLAKSKRISHAWAKKREDAGNTGMTRICPAWLEPVRQGDKVTYRKIHERAKIVERIFEYATKGIGKEKTASILNSEGVPTFDYDYKKRRKANGWHLSYIGKILANRAVYGVFQPCRDTRVNNKRVRVADGEPIQEYYPMILSRAVFDAAKAATASRSVKRGRTGKRYPNLFSGIARCGSCAGPMRYKNSGARRDGSESQWLICDTAKRKLPGNGHPDPKQRTFPCSSTVHYDYLHIENTVLRWLLSLTIREDDCASDAKARLISEIALKQDAHARLAAKVDGLMRSDLGNLAMQALAKMETEAEELAGEIARLTDQLEIARGELSKQDHQAIILDLRERMDTGTEQEVYEARAHVAQGLRRIITHMACLPFDRTVHLQTDDMKVEVDLENRMGSLYSTHRRGPNSRLHMRIVTASEEDEPQNKMSFRRPRPQTSSV